MSTLTDSKSPSLESNQLCQIGLTNSASTNALLSSFSSTLVQQYIAAKQSAGKRKKRQSTYTFTCDDLNTLGTGVTSLTVAQLSTLTTNEFYKCQTLLGTSTNQWSSAQLTQLATIAKSLYGSASSISDTNITALNTIMVGFSSTDLATLTFTTTTSIGALGALSGWSTDQVIFILSYIIIFILN